VFNLPHYSDGDMTNWKAAFPDSRGFSVLAATAYAWCPAATRVTGDASSA